MRPTSIPRVSLTKSIHNRFSSIFHPPLPLSPIESRKFLSLVKESFRDQLDASTPKVSPIENHFSQIFAAAAQSSEITATDGLGKEERIKKFLNDPIGVINEQMLLGKATVDLAAICLTRHAKLQRDAGAGAGAGAVEVNQQNGRGPVAFVLEGLRKAGLGTPGELLKSRKLVEAVTYTLVVEGRESVILRWVRASEAEVSLAVRQTVLKVGIFHVRRMHGWKRAEDLFRRVMAGVRENQGRFTLQAHCVTGLELCKAGVEDGFSGSPEFSRLIRSSVHWTVHRQQQAMVHLRYGKMTAVGVKYFDDLSHREEEFWERSGAFWYHKCSKLAMELVLECLAQNQLKEAEMITELLKRRFVGKVAGLDPESVGAKFDAGRAGVEKKKIAPEPESGEQSSDLQGILNGLG
ncbi:hypothetical protein Q9L58_009353 [Maublancomyces gigas]|uniref:Uncharacterized protein n=1 Tax=Discina gigas TaxID=1032678 RepID=A0ABR3G753_9PEZI